MKPDTPKVAIGRIARDFGLGLTAAFLIGIPAHTIYENIQIKKEQRKVEQSKLESKALTNRLIQDVENLLDGNYQKFLDFVGVEYNLKPGERVEIFSVGEDSAGFLVQKENGLDTLQYVHRGKLQKYVDSEKK